jgi:uncharacterized Zn finger protein
MSKVGKTWWGRRFLEVLGSFIEPGPRASGRQYLTTHRIARWEINGNRVETQIRGKVNPYYGAHKPPNFQVAIEFAPIPGAAWDEALALIGSRAGYVSRLMFNEMPDEIERPLAELGVRLLPASQDEIVSRCTCQEAEIPCRHITALYYLLAGRLDQDPFLLFELRGLSRAELIQRLKTTPLGSALASALDAVPPPPLLAESFFTRPVAGVEPVAPAAVSGILIRKGGDYPPFWDKEESFVEVMDAFYEQVRKKGKDWL